MGSLAYSKPLTVARLVFRSQNVFRKAILGTLSEHHLNRHSNSHSAATIVEDPHTAATFVCFAIP